MSNKKNCIILTLEEFLTKHKDRQPNEGYLLFYDHNDEELDRKRFDQGIRIPFDRGSDKPIPYMRLEAIVRTCIKYPTIFICADFLNKKKIFKNNMVTMSIGVFHGMLHGKTTMNLQDKEGDKRREDCEKLLKSFYSMYKKMSDNKHMEVHKFVKEDNVEDYSSFERLVTILDHKAVEHNFIVRAKNEELHTALEGIGALSVNVARISSWEELESGLPVKTMEEAREIIKSVKRPFTDVLSPIFALN
jgi:hypothetical protein